jgi:photosystem II stability/assembly factor-like uncharacterized protein
MKSHLTTLGLFALVLVLVGQGCLSASGGDAVKTTGPAGMFVSTDRGDSWRQISLLPGAAGVETIAGEGVYRLLEDPQDPRTMYWASRDGGLFYTYDDGKTWQQAEAPLNTGFVYAVAVHPKDKCTVYATNGRFIYKTIDCNRTWTEVYRETRPDVLVSSLDISQFPPYQVYMAETNGDLFQSLDLGQSWNVVRRFKARLSKVVVDKTQEGVLYVATRTKGLVRSDDGGETWTALAETMEDYSKALEFRRFFLHPYKADTLYWISQYGILVSTDRGASWEPMGLLTAPGSVQIYGFAINPQDDNHIYYTATANNRSTFYRSIDGGANWITKKLPSGQIPTALRIHPEEPDWIYVGFTIPSDN